MKRLLVALATAVISAGALSTPSASRAEEPEPLQYVALGDSYAAASGVLPLAPGAPLQCLQSTRNFAHVIAGRVGAELTDVTCGGAQTGDYFEPQYPGVPAQLDALSADTDLVTMTIGGNDNDVFIGAIIKCGSAGLSTLGKGSPCKDRYGSSFADTINGQTYPDLVRALRAARAQAPDAEVAILGYPWIVPKEGGCFLKLPVATGDVPYLRHIQWTLNDAVRRAAAAAGATYVNMNRASDGHDACQRAGVRWVEPVLFGSNPVVVHPNALGEARMAARAMAVLGLS